MEDKYDPDKAMSFEVSKRAQEEKSKKVAWIIAGVMTVITFLLSIGIVSLLPLKTVEPFLVEVNKSNGMVNVVPVLKEKTITTLEATDKHFVSLYVQKREAYYHDILDDDYVKVQSMSTSKVAKEYIRMYEGANGRAEILQDDFNVRVNIKSIVLGVSAGTKMATVRVEIRKKDLKSNFSEKPIIKVITLAYKYVPELKQKEKLKLFNPLGFQVTTYRTDREAN